MTKHYFILVLAAAAAAAHAAHADGGKPARWTFDDGKPDAQPPAFGFARTGSGAVGKWVIKAVGDAPSGKHVLAQIDADKTSNRFPIAVADAPALADLALSVKCKPVSGKVDQACGLVLRYQDANNYYVTRANPLEGNIRFYYVKDGTRRELASWSGKVTANAWHDYRVEAKGDRFVVTFDGTKVLDVKDATFAKPGKVGLWTKADSVTYFDDLAVESR